MKRVLDPERRAAIAARLRFYSDLGVYDFYRRAVPSDAREVSLAGDAAAESADTFDSGSVSKPMEIGTVLDKPAALAAIREDLGDCKRCKLHQLGRKQIVFGVGNPEADLMFVGEGPGADEDQQGEPFVGRAGQLLNNMITAMGLRREDVYICNVVKCRPPGNRTPEPDEMEICGQFLYRQLTTIQPKAICA